MTKRNRFILQLRETFPIQIVSTYNSHTLGQISFVPGPSKSWLASIYLSISTRKIEKLKRKRNPMLADANF